MGAWLGSGGGGPPKRCPGHRPHRLPPHPPARTPAGAAGLGPITESCGAGRSCSQRVGVGSPSDAGPGGADAGLLTPQLWSQDAHFGLVLVVLEARAPGLARWAAGTGNSLDGRCPPSFRYSTTSSLTEHTVSRRFCWTEDMPGTLVCCPAVAVTRGFLLGIQALSSLLTGPRSPQPLAGWG